MHPTLPLAVLLAALSAAAPGLAQPSVPSPRPIRSAAAPEPSAGRYPDHPDGFQDPLVRLEALDARASTLRDTEARAVGVRLRAIHVEARRAYGGGLGDWDRERLQRMMNEVVKLHPALRS